MKLVSNRLGRNASQPFQRSCQTLFRPGSQLGQFKFRGLSGWTLLGLMAGILLFTGIISHANPAMAQLFDTVEGQAQTIFGQYLDPEPGPSTAHYRQLEFRPGSTAGQRPSPARQRRLYPIGSHSTGV